MKALITAGGRGTRLRPITYSMNKHLIPVANKPMIFYALEKIAEAGITEVAISINEGDHTMEEAVGDGSRWGLSVSYLEQIGGALGVAHVIKNAHEWLGDDSFVFYLGDNIVLGSIKPMVEAFQESGANAYLALSKVDDPERFGVPVIDKDGKITEVIEKPENPPSDFAVTGVYCYDKTVHDAIDGLKPSERGELEISDTHTQIIRSGGRIEYQIVEGWWKDTGKPFDLLEGNALLLDQIEEKNEASKVDDGVIITGKVSIGKDAQLLGQTVIRGPVAIGDGAIIRDSIIAEHSAIGNKTEVTSSEIQHSIIMDEADIRCGKKISNSIIGHNATISDVRESDDPDAHHMIIGENAQLEL